MLSGSHILSATVSTVQGMGVRRLNPDRVITARLAGTADRHEAGTRWTVTLRAAGQLVSRTSRPPSVPAESKRTSVGPSRKAYEAAASQAARWHSDEPSTAGPTGSASPRGRTGSPTRSASAVRATTCGWSSTHPEALRIPMASTSTSEQPSRGPAVAELASPATRDRLRPALLDGHRP
jgi:hypothetical protein